MKLLFTCVVSLGFQLWFLIIFIDNNLKTLAPSSLTMKCLKRSLSFKHPSYSPCYSLSVSASYVKSAPKPLMVHWGRCKHACSYDIQNVVCHTKNSINKAKVSHCEVLRNSGQLVRLLHYLWLTVPSEFPSAQLGPSILGREYKKQNSSKKLRIPSNTQAHKSRGCFNYRALWYNEVR